jgi:hypothetical protein
MNDTMSLVLATGILAIGGLGLYMYKNNDLNTDNDDETYDENILFGKGGFFGGKNDEDENTDINDEEDYEVVEEPKKRVKGSKTKRARKTSGTKRRY